MATGFIVLGFFGLFLVTFIADAFLSRQWGKAYYTTGFPLLVWQVPVMPASGTVPEMWYLQQQFEFLPIGALVFNEIAPNTYGLGLELRPFAPMRFTPLVHGMLVFDTVRKRVIVRGFLNWMALLHLSVWVLLVIVIPDCRARAGVVAGLVALIGPVVWAQLYAFRAAARFAAATWSGKRAPTGDRGSPEPRG